MFFTRRRNFPVFNRAAAQYKSLLDFHDPSSRSSSDLFDLSDSSSSGLGSVDDADDVYPPTKRPLRKNRRNCCGLVVHTPNTSRFRHHWHSRLLQKFPFLNEMFYWVINYAFYRMTAVISQRIFASTGIWEVARGHGIQVLSIEKSAPVVHWLFPLRERAVQQWFMGGHQTALTVLNRVYALSESRLPHQAGKKCVHVLTRLSSPHSGHRRLHRVVLLLRPVL